MLPIQDQLCNLQGTVQNENSGPLVQKLWITSKWQQQNVKPSTGPYRAQKPVHLQRLHTHEAGREIPLREAQEAFRREHSDSPSRESLQGRSEPGCWENESRNGLPILPSWGCRMKIPFFSSTENAELERNKLPFRDLFVEDGGNYTHVHILRTFSWASQAPWVLPYFRLL